MRVLAVVSTVLLVVTLVVGGIFYYRQSEQLTDKEAQLQAALQESAQTEEDVVELRTKVEGYENLCPPRDFESYEDLEAFVKENIQPHTDKAGDQYGNARNMQELAMGQGYLISVGISDAGDGELLIFNLAEAGNELWWWFPDDNKLQQYSIAIYK